MNLYLNPIYKTLQDLREIDIPVSMSIYNLRDLDRLNKYPNINFHQQDY